MPCSTSRSRTTRISGAFRPAVSCGRLPDELTPSVYPCLPRFMALTELTTECGASTPLTVDEYTEAKLVEMVLRLMEDTNGEVKNAGVKASVPFLASTLSSLA